MAKVRIPIKGAEHIMGATVEVDAADAPRRYRIRHCDGNKDAWMLCALRDDGSEADSYGSFTTAMSLDALLKHARHLTPRPQDHVELILGGEG